MRKFLCFVLVFLFIFILFGDVYAVHEANIDEISDYFSPNNVCKEKSSDCYKEPQYKFYQKMYDLYYLYLTKYNVKLDLSLLMSTLSFNNDDIYTTFKLNLNDYERKEIVESDWNPNFITSLDWDYDYKSKDNYLVANDSSMDMQILAKNMVSKITLQKCVKDGNIVKSQRVKDYEDNLICNDGETFELGDSTYELDLNKYDDFLLEYIEKKFYLNRFINNPTVSNGPDYYSDKLPSIVKRKNSSTGSNNNSSSNSGHSGQNINSNKSYTVGEKMVQVALNEYEKYKNGQTSAYTYQSDGGLNQYAPWCAAFVSYVAKRTKINDKTVADIVGSTFNGAGYYLRYFEDTDGINFYFNDSCSYYKGKNGNNTYIPKPGDYIIYSSLNCSDIDYRNTDDCHYHIGLVEKVEDGIVYTIEGNVNNGQMGKKANNIDSCGIIGYCSWY